jgi:hypothetical protein
MFEKLLKMVCEKPLKQLEKFVWKFEFEKM